MFDKEALDPNTSPSNHVRGYRTFSGGVNGYKLVYLLMHLELYVKRTQLGCIPFETEDQQSL